ncbi:ABL050Wp [Eremothecium gossypii ATCC 10895]|uniref:ATPase synthesis protein 25, mitochondrial n=1 Tax=Eremothecium gossypii (strain ATCC 10895 / CBS 109.51 / FGSC 9923 / NRRL Y-1056) TaxID=284811 RepID=ATP25_EREGS|nr:ABL050Wp [Eremothecium gossypii ATCC 10895]Q75DR7.2 RecName: Full=ATPase synthesis protein 25, mitochondrial; Flags: Precursor [Eremothecium gossypii ATCC 10895]AAS50721.2 ABL050Wp [Eremothecium gossypii ATCC 10895]
MLRAGRYSKASSVLRAVGGKRPSVCMASRVLTRLYSNGKEDDQVASSSSPSSKPWYLQGTGKPEIDVTSPFVGKIKLPATPVPDTVVNVTEYMRDKLGVTDITCFNTHEAHRPCVKNGYVILGCVKSTRHGARSMIELMRFLKTEYGVLPQKEGGISVQELRKRQKRLQRKGNLTSASAELAGESDWYLIDSKLYDGNGSGVFVHLLTKEKREDLNLEGLYCTSEERGLYQKKVLSPSNDHLPNDDDDNVLAGLKRLALQNSRRYYSSTSSATADYARSSLQGGSNMENSDAPLFSLVDSLAQLPETEELDPQEWIRSLDAKWAFIDLTEKHWQARWLMYRLLYVNRLHALQRAQDGDSANLDHLKRDLTFCYKTLLEYFTLKQAMNGRLNKEELVGMLDIMLTQKELNGGYSKLVKHNRVLQQLLDHYKFHEPELFRDEQITIRTLKLMVSSQAKLNVLSEFVRFLRDTGYTNRNVAIKCIEILAEAKEWRELKTFMFRDTTAALLSDPMVWAHFLRSILAHGEPLLWRSLIDDGSILWLVRCGVDVRACEELHSALLELFQRAGYDAVKADSLLRDYIQDGACS